MLRDEFEGDVPQNVDDLCKLPGVGPKVAFLTLQNAWNMLVVLVYLWSCVTDPLHSNTGIGVDVHVERITNRLGWHSPPTKGVPEKAR
jgi:endonuclease-3